MRLARTLDASAEDTAELAFDCSFRPPWARPTAPLFVAHASDRSLEYPAFQQLLVYVSALLGGLWYCYSRLPDWLQELIRSLWKWKENKDE